MRLVPCLLLAAACSSAPPPAPRPPEPAPAPAPKPAAAPAPEAPKPELLTADTPRTTSAGHAFVAPAGWTIAARGPVTLLAPPEAGSRIALVDVHGADAADAVAQAWAVYQPGAKWPVKSTTGEADHDGWDHIEQVDYQISPNLHREIAAVAHHAGDGWLVIILDMAQDVAEKRLGQVAVVAGHLLPKGYSRESFAGKQAHELDSARIAELVKFVDTAHQDLGVPGVAFGIVQGGKVVYAGGVGVRELGGKAAPDADTLFVVASNTKALTTLMLAKLVDEGKLTWETTVTSLLPTFQLGNAETTKQVLVKHLICACTGLPRQDLEFLFEFAKATPETEMATLATIQPTSKFGEMFQYSNMLAAAAGFVGGHVVFPKLALGVAYDKAMQTRVFDPLGMKATTFDFKRALAGNHAAAHAVDVDGKPARATFAVDYAVIPVRPAGGAWSSVRDMLRYVQMELDEGTVGGKRYVSKEALLARRAPQVAIGKDATYGMGLMVDTKYGVPVVHHGGDLIGFHSDMIWLPDQHVGAVILTNGDPGWLVRDMFRRKLLEVLFDGNHEADARIAADGKAFRDQLAAERKLMTIPAAAEDAGKLAAHYANPALGEITVKHEGKATIFDFGEWKSEVASRHNPDGSVSFLTIAPGVTGFELVVGAGEPQTLVLRDAQHAYTFTSR
jgi:CubicO group peptidase (beta-lactamase class C family)